MQIGNYLNQFRRGRRLADQVFITKAIITCHVYKIPAVILFINFKKVWTRLGRVMKEFKVPAKLIISAIAMNWWAESIALSTLWQGTMRASHTPSFF